MALGWSSREKKTEQRAGCSAGLVQEKEMPPKVYARENKEAAAWPAHMARCLAGSVGLTRTHKRKRRRPDSGGKQRIEETSNREGLEKETRGSNSRTGTTGMNSAQADFKARLQEVW